MATPFQFVSYPACLSGSGGGGGSVVWANETPAGVVNNVNVTFTILNAPSDVKTLEVFEDGLLLTPVTDYTFAGTTITMVVAPNFGQTLYAYYRKT